MPARTIAVVAMLALSSAAATAQTTVPAVHRLEIAAGGGLFGGGELGDRDANLRANQATPTPYRLFSTASSFSTSPFVEARLGLALTRRFGIEGRFAFNRPQLRTSISADAEQASGVTAAESIDQYIVDASVMVMIDTARTRGFLPFVAAGGGYLRQLHEGQTVVDEGRVFHVGGGVKRWLFARERRLITGAGMRLDARVYLLAGGAAFDERMRPHGAVSGSMFVVF